MAAAVFRFREAFPPWFVTWPAFHVIMALALYLTSPKSLRRATAAIGILQFTVFAACVAVEISTRNFPGLVISDTSEYPIYSFEKLFLLPVTLVRCR